MALKIKKKFLIPGKEGFIAGKSEAKVDPGGRWAPPDYLPESLLIEELRDIGILHVVARDDGVSGRDVFGNAGHTV